MHNKKKTIFLALSFPMSVRNLLKNKFFEYLTDRYQVVVFSMMTTDTEFIKEFKRENVHFCDLKFDFKKFRFSKQSKAYWSRKSAFFTSGLQYSK